MSEKILIIYNTKKSEYDIWKIKKTPTDDGHNKRNVKLLNKVSPEITAAVSSIISDLKEYNNSSPLIYFSIKKRPTPGNASGSVLLTHISKTTASSASMKSVTVLKQFIPYATDILSSLYNGIMKTFLKQQRYNVDNIGYGEENNDSVVNNETLSIYDESVNHIMNMGTEDNEDININKWMSNLIL